MPKRLEVFISSTSIDLQDYREAVSDAINQAGEYSIDMKYFGSRPDDPQTVCEEEIRKADVLIGIYAWRYGWVPEGETRSITEIEFDHARALGKPCLCYVVDEKQAWPPPYMEMDALPQLKAFKEKIGKLVHSTFTTPDNLAVCVMAGLARHMKEHAQQEQSARAAAAPTKKTVELIPPEDALFVNRKKQDDHFLEVFWSSQPAKPLFFYVYGDARQAHDALSRRFGYTVAGRQQTWRQQPETGNEANQMPKRWKYQQIKPEFSAHHQLNFIKLMIELYKQFDVDFHAPDQCALPNLLKSRLLSGFNRNDTVLLLLTLDRHNWHPQHVPEVVRKFINKFCSETLPENAPRFLFFFGIEYDENNRQLREEIKKAIDERQHGGEVLEELAPVTPDDLEAWFSKPSRRPLRKEDETDRDVTLRYFGPKEKHDMQPVIKTLERIIEEYNNDQL